MYNLKTYNEHTIDSLFLYSLSIFRYIYYKVSHPRSPQANPHFIHLEVTMTTTPLQTPSANLKKAICWLGEVVLKHPDKQREKVVQEAELRFDLTPAECEFLNSNFTDLATGRCSE